MTRYETGLSGEAQAEKYLVEQGMQAITRRYRGEDGEIDLVMQDGEYIVFVEVKARRRGGYGDGMMAVTPNKQRRMIHAATAFLLEREWMERPVRFDVVEITRDGLIHVPNAFMAQ